MNLSNLLKGVLTFGVFGSARLLLFFKDVWKATQSPSVSKSFPNQVVTVKAFQRWGEVCSQRLEVKGHNECLSQCRLL